MSHNRTVALALRVWLPVLALGVLLFAEGFAVGLTGFVFIALAVVGAAYGFLLLERSSPVELGLIDVIRVLLLFLVVSVPMLADGQARDGVNLARFVLVALGAIAIGVGLVAVWMRSRSVKVFRNGMGMPLSALLVGTILAAIFARNVRVGWLGAAGSYDGVFLLIGLVVLFVGCTAAISITQLRAYLMGFVAASGPIMFLALVQFRDKLLAGFWEWLPGLPNGPTVGSTLGNSNHLGAFMSILLPIVAALALTERRPKVRVGLFGLLGPILVCLVLARSEGAFVAAVAGGAVLVAALFLKLPDRFSLRRPWIARFGFACLPIAVAATLFAMKPLLNDLAARLLEAGQTSTAGQRFSLWTAAIEMAQDDVFLGWGPDAYRLMFPTYQDYQFVDSFGPNQLANGAHNLFFNQLANTGAIGLVALSAFVAFLYLRGIAALRYSKVLRAVDAYREPTREARFYLIALIASITAYLVQASFNVQQVALSFVFWLLAGLLTVASLDLGVSPSSDPGRVLEEIPPPEENKKKRAAPTRHGLAVLPYLRDHDDLGRWSAPTLVATWVLIALGLLTASIVVRPYRAARTAYRARLVVEAVNPENPLPVERRFELLDEGGDRYGDAFELNPWEYEYARAAGNTEYLYGVNESVDETAIIRIRRAAEWYGKAHDLRPRDPEMMLAYSRVLSALYRRTGHPGVRAAAVETIGRAFQINPWDPAVSSRLVALLRDLGDRQRARSVLRVALQHRPDDVTLQDLGKQLDVPVPPIPSR